MEITNLHASAGAAPHRRRRPRPPSMRAQHASGQSGRPPACTRPLAPYLIHPHPHPPPQDYTHPSSSSALKWATSTEKEGEGGARLARTHLITRSSHILPPTPRSKALECATSTKKERKQGARLARTHAFTRSSYASPSPHPTAKPSSTPPAQRRSASRAPAWRAHTHLLAPLTRPLPHTPQQSPQVRHQHGEGGQAGRPPGAHTLDTRSSHILPPTPRSKALKYATSTEKVGEEGARLARTHLILAPPTYSPPRPAAKPSSMPPARRRRGRRAPAWRACTWGWVPREPP